MLKLSRFWFVLSSSTCMLLATEARADRIDGEWCLANSHFRIDGPTIVTPAGNTLRGGYSRHGFVYTVPLNEPGAGSEIVMVLLNEETVQLSRARSGTPEIWRRCKVTS